MEIRWKHDREHMNVNQRNGVTFLTYPALEAFSDFCHGFSTRLGGVSEGIYASMNLSFTRGDKPEAVQENYRRMAAALGVSPEQMVCSDQTHTANVRVMTKADAGKGILQKKDYQDVDGMITNVPGLVLVTSFADCVPLFFIDPIQKAIGLSHSGWRGTIGRIGAETVKAMAEAYGSVPENLYAAIGPSICQDCYEVGEEVAQKFEQAFPTYKEKQELLYPKRNGKYQLNLWKANEIILREAGIRPEHISFPGICTCCNPDFLFSHRASGGKRGNLSAFLEIREK